jgi:hypothetical protein
MVPVNGPVHQIFGKEDRFHAGNTPAVYVYPPFPVGIKPGEDKIHILGAIRDPTVPGIPVKVIKLVRVQDAGEEFPVKIKLPIVPAGEGVVYNGGGKSRVRPAGPHQGPDRLRQDDPPGQGFVGFQRQFFEGVGIGKMSQIVEQTGAQKGPDPLGAKPCIRPPIGKVL